jgi:transposase
MIATRTTSIRNAWCIGVDLHKTTLYAAALCPTTGQILEQRIACKCRDKILAFFQNLPRPHVVAIESMGSYRWLWELLEPVVNELHLADAAQARALAGRRIKTDREDALNLAELLIAGRLPEAYVPPEHVRQLRSWTRQRNALSREHARVLHRVKALLAQANRPGPARLKADGLIRYLRGQGDKLPPDHVAQLWMAVDRMTMIERQIDNAEREIKTRLDDERFQTDAELLQTIPGVGPVVTATVLAEIGEFQRFDTRETIVRYAGLDPRTFQSDQTVRHGRMSKAGSPDLRWVLQQAAWVGIRCDERPRRLCARITKRRGRKRAAAAVARHILIWMWAMMRDRTAYGHRLD